MQKFLKQDTKAIISHMMAHTQESEWWEKVAQTQNSHILKTEVVVYSPVRFSYSCWMVFGSFLKFSPGGTQNFHQEHYGQLIWAPFVLSGKSFNQGQMERCSVWGPSSDPGGPTPGCCESAFLVSIATRQQLYGRQPAYAISNPIAKPPQVDMATQTKEESLPADLGKLLPAPDQSLLWN